MNQHFSGRLGVQQRVLPNYRAPFFDLLAQSCEAGMSLFAGLARPEEGIAPAHELRIAHYSSAQNMHILRGSLYLCYQRGFINWLREWNPDVLIAEANPRYLATPSAVKWMHARGRKVIGWGLGSPPVSGFRKTRRVQFLNQFDALISYSQRGSDEYAELGFPREKIFVAPNAVSPAPAEKPDDKPQTIDRATILFVGRLQARKRVDSLLRACAEMESMPRLIIVGDGPERDGLEQLSKQVYPSAQFIGAKHGAELKPYFAEADLFALPGTGGLAIQEAMSHGLPVIVAKGDGTQDDLVRVGNGWQIAPEDYDALVVTMKDALSDIPHLRQMGMESYRIAREEINLEKMVEVFVRALISLR
ncbi:MAG: glycosyltransferase family 4 protein [Anaerolineales bacterium]|nr:glycosyltransferase family 4 protein [Anaerolineales bacterium]